MRSGHFVLERVSKYFECLQSSNPFHTHFLLFRKWQEFPNNYLWFIFSIVVYFWALLSSILSCCPISFGLFLDLCSSVPFGLVECSICWQRMYCGVWPYLTDVPWELLAIWAKSGRVKNSGLIILFYLVNPSFLTPLWGMKYVSLGLET